MGPTISAWWRAAVVRSGSPGLDLEVTNAGHIATEGDAAIGIALGVASLGFRPAAGGRIENSGVIESQGDGAAGVFMSGDDHHLINSGRITADGGAFFSDTLEVTLHAAGVAVSGDDAVVA